MAHLDVFDPPLRLLKLPAAWTGFIDTNTTGTSCLGPLAILVSRPEPPALAQAARTGAELAALVDAIERDGHGVVPVGARRLLELARAGASHDSTLVEQVHESVR